METRSPAIPRAARCPAPGGQFPALLRLDGFGLSLAADLPSLEACLALERTSGAAQSPEGIQSPQAVPYCDFLMLRAPGGSLAAVCRLMRLDANNPIPSPLAAGRFQLSPLLTALRYSREGILEMGAPAFAAGSEARGTERAARLLWTGMSVYLERNGLGFVIGRDVLAVPAEPTPGWKLLMADHGLPPDLQTESRAGYRVREDGLSAGSRAAEEGDSEPLKYWPAGLQEALLRGCRLACEPAYDPANASLEFVWVASRDMLEERLDWRGNRR